MNFQLVQMVLLPRANQYVPFPSSNLRKSVGPAMGKGNEMYQWVLKTNGNVVPQHTVRPLKVDEIHNPVEKKKRKTFDSLIERRRGTALSPP